MDQCLWEIKIEGCKDVSFFRTIIGITLILHIIAFILSTSLLLYRKIKCNSIIWNGQCFTALDGFLLWADIWCIGRIIFIVDQLTNLTKNTIILRFILFEIMAFPPIVAVATFASGLFYAISRMNLQNHPTRPHTSTSLKSKLNIIKNLPQPLSLNQSLYLPRPHIVSRFYWLFIIFFFVMTFTPLMVSAIAEQNNNNALRDIFWAIHFLIYAAAFGLLTIVLTYYGRMLVHLAEESASLSNGEFEKQRYKKFAKKMKISNLTLTLVFLWYIIGMIIFAFCRRQIYSHELINKIFAFMIEILSVVAALITICALFYSEMISPIITLVGMPSTWSSNDDNVITD